jgi:glycosyltransferase involved in cell wall biosynthesis
MRKRVMQLVLSLSPGGTERLVVEICKGLQSRVDSVVCCLDEAGAWAAELDALGIPVIALGRRPGFHPELARKIADVIRSNRIDVVHCHHYSPYVYGLLASLITGVKLVFTEHGRLHDGQPSRKRQLVNPLLSLLPGRIFAVSGDLRQHMIKEGFPARCIEVIYNGIDPGPRPSEAARVAARAALGLSQDAFVIGTAGRLDPVKNLALLLQAHALVRDRVPGAQLAIIGDGPERAALESRAAALGASGSVMFAGYRSDVRALMQAFDVYVNSSNYEGVSLTILEAMASGVPVIATSVGGNPEVVVDVETGYLVPSSAPAIGDAIARLAHQPHVRRKLGDAARWRVRRHFSIGRMVDQYAAVYFGERHQAAQVPPMQVPAAADRMSVSDATRSAV